jgi:hypothetical protein
MPLFRSSKASSGGGGASALADLTDVTITSPSSGQVLTYDGNGWVNGAGGGSSVAIMTQTLSAGATSVTFTNIPTTGTYSVDVYTSMAGLDYNSIDDSVSGQLTITYDAQSVAITVTLRIEGYSE